MFLILFISGLVLFIYYKLYLPHQYWKKRNIPYSKPWPIVGSMGPIVARQKSLMDFSIDLFNDFPKVRYNGIYMFLQPALFLKDLDLIKQIGIKDFDHFLDHINVTNTDDIIGKTLIALTGQDWKDMRTTLSPIFTSSKMKAMFYLMSDCSEDLTKYYLEIDCDVIDIEMKDTFSRYTNDVIATTAFGIKCNSLKERENEFYVWGTKVTAPTALQTIKAMLVRLMPFILKFGVSLFPKELTEFFTRLVTTNIEERETKGIVRPDLIHLLMEARKGNLKHEINTDTREFAAAETHNIDTNTEKKSKIELTDEVVTAQAIIFFLAGFETASMLSSFMAHELAVNPDIQAKLRQEIDATVEECDGKITYDALLKMEYLDQVISETLRMWPPVFQTDRVCVKDYVIKAKLPSEKDLFISEGTHVVIPIIAIQRNPEYYPNPNKFDPDRFSNENRQNVLPGSFLPFGIGPRNCIGSRFALLEIKIVFFNLLSKFEFVVIDKTEVPIKLSPKKINMAPENGFWLGLKRR